MPDPAKADLKTMLSPSPLSRSDDASHAVALRRNAAGVLASGALLLLAMSAAAALWAGLGAWFVPRALAVFGAGAVCVWRALSAHAPQPRFGPANGITLLRLGLVALLAAAAFEPVLATPAGAWVAVALATTAALLDALDGPVARHRREAMDFGARFDMETDALLVAVLCVAVWQLDKAGAWVLASGAMRYAFVLAAGVWPWLERPLPPSRRRKTVCVLQIVFLIVCLGPIVAPAQTAAIAGAGLALLLYSFMADIAWLARHRRTAHDVVA